MLLKLAALSQVPRSDRVVQTSRPKFGTVSGNVYTRCPVGMTLELSDQCLIVQVPNSYITVRTTAEANLQENNNEK